MLCNVTMVVHVLLSLKPEAKNDTEKCVCDV